MLGNSINEKRRDHAGMAEALHTVFGLNRYPNYLYRFRSDQDQLLKLESSLERQLELFRRQKHEILYLESLRDEFATFQAARAATEAPGMLLSQWLSSSFFESIGIADCTIEEFTRLPLSSSMRLSIVDVLKESAPGIYEFDLLHREASVYLKNVTVEFSTFLKKKLEQELSLGVTNSDLTIFCKRPPSLYHMGLSIIEHLLLTILNAVYPLLFPDYSSLGELDWCQGYVVGYSSILTSGVQRSALVHHTDDSEVTINIALTDDYSGGSLCFGRMRGSDCTDSIEFSTKPSAGIALIHSGRMLHEVREVTAGERFNLILWSRSSKLRSSCCPCCWMNNRGFSSCTDDCICGEYWN
jgi:hypothetical protein